MTLDLLDTAVHEPLVGSMLLLTQPSGGGEELALGTVTEVTTMNQWHSQPLLRGVVKARGHIPGMSGDLGDVRAASIKLQACYKRNAFGQPQPWVQAGPSLRMSPPTGTAVRRVTNEVLDELMSGEEDLHYLGHLHGTADVRIPLSIRDFSGDRGAFHAGLFGMSGSGKALALDTPVATPGGWTTMGELSDGDLVFDETGRPTRVVKAHEVRLDRPCYEVVFSDGSVIVADADHNWYTEDEAARRSAGTARRSEGTRKRRPLLAPAITGRLRRLAAAAAPEDVITVPEVVALTGLHRRSSALTTVTTAVGTLGAQRATARFEYRAQQYTKTRTLVAWPGRELLTALASVAEAGRPSAPVFNPSLAPRLREAAADAADWLSLPDVARLIGLPARNANLRRKVETCSIPAHRRPMPVRVTLPAHTVERAPANAVLTYPRRRLLTALADHADRPVGDQRHKRITGRVVTTEQIRRTLRTSDGESNHAVPVAGPLVLPEQRLPLDPYFLGYWLGDGKASDARIYTADAEVLDTLRGRGFVVTATGRDFEFRVTWGDPAKEAARAARPCARCAAPFTPAGPRRRYCSNACRLDGPRATRADGAGRCTDCGRSGVSGLRCMSCHRTATPTGVLRHLGVLHDKHVPDRYLRGSQAQRRALLAGLLDSDGTPAPQGTVLLRQHQPPAGAARPGAGGLPRLPPHPDEQDRDAERQGVRSDLPSRLHRGRRRLRPEPQADVARRAPRRPPPGEDVAPVRRRRPARAVGAGPVHHRGQPEPPVPGRPHHDPDAQHRVLGVLPGRADAQSRPGFHRRRPAGAVRLRDRFPVLPAGLGRGDGPGGRRAPRERGPAAGEGRPVVRGVAGQDEADR
ncbi:Hint domain-containing protein [Kineococcus aurantiacus]|uniref:Hint domain-containing protein n=1 Tax=Kineococcus aurantiacus TaxID=37633 RepID=A0A7Y9J389_9ACTN|nr:Hint domain-containing protein [Kineococcus aurantiacus]NYD24860.1 hypothetical protein [Kineococcus aurantiacus]